METAAPTAPSINPAEADFFGKLAADWWNPRGSSAMLHRINPLRLGYIRAAALARFGRAANDRYALNGLRALDVGCGAGLLTEPLARMGASVTGLDAAADNIAVARLHAEAGGLTIDYHGGSVEALAAGITAASETSASETSAGSGKFDLITCLEVIEHVADRSSFLTALASLLAPGGLLIMSTPNRTPLSYATLIVGAERVVRNIPQGAHDWRRFMTPDELTAALAAAGLLVTDLTGLTWRPGAGFTLGRETSVNYLLTAVPA